MCEKSSSANLCIVSAISTTIATMFSTSYIYRLDRHVLHIIYTHSSIYKEVRSYVQTVLLKE
jgi:hypothetical protein